MTVRDCCLIANYLQVNSQGNHIKEIDYCCLLADFLCAAVSVAQGFGTANCEFRQMNKYFTYHSFN